MIVESPKITLFIFSMATTKTANGYKKATEKQKSILVI
jgi:hypothetical protein